MTIYVTRNYGTFGKEFPAIPNQRFTTARFGGRAGGIIQGVTTLGRWALSHRRSLTKVGSAVAGSAISGVALNESTDRFNKTLRTKCSSYLHMHAKSSYW